MVRIKKINITEIDKEEEKKKIFLQIICAENKTLLAVLAH
jgi:hypothetical protein